MTADVAIAGHEEFEKLIPRLAEILIDAVESGAGVSFMLPLPKAEAEAFWRGQVSDVAAGRTFPVIARTNGEVAGVVLLHKAWPPNQPHRAEIAKLLVHRQHRRKGLGAALVGAAEAKARALGLRLITFDAVAHGAADALYRGLGFRAAGVIPGYAFSPTGELDDTVVFYKQL